MKAIVQLLLNLHLLLLAGSAFAQQNTPTIHRVFISGNFADIPDAELDHYTDALKILFEKQTTPFTFLHNGDLVANKKNETINWDQTQKRIDKILKTAQLPDSRHVFNGGDRDWSSSGEEGWKQVKKLEKLVEKTEAKRVSWAPGKGCPGPKAKLLANNVLLILINTQWWNHTHDKPGPTDADCNLSRDADFIEELEDIIEEAGNTNIILAGHYPLESNGPYGGKATFRQHLFPLTDASPNFYLPLPIIGSLYTSYRKNVGNKLDISNEKFTEIREELIEIVEETPQLIYVSGHEKNIEILQEGESFYINSGAAYATSSVRKDKATRYHSKKAGLIEMVYHPDGRVEYRVHHYSPNGFTLAQSAFLLGPSCEAATGELPANHSFVPCLEEVKTEAGSSLIFPPSYKTIAGEEYNISKFSRLFMGQLYRDAWSEEVEIPTLDIGTTLGGLTPLERGGGAQTQSLKFRAANGKEYVFRSVNKNPVQALPNDLHTSFFTYLARQSTATQHPYGALAVANLLDNTDILHARPKLYFLPDDPRLGAYREEFAGMLGMLEDRPKKPKKNRAGSFDADEILRSYQLFNKLYSSHNNRMDVQALLDARVFDIWAGDRGRHEENFKWAGFKQDKGTLYRPIPRDRDHVFSRLNGLLPWIIDQPWGLPYFEDFGAKIKDIRSLNYSARHLDRSLLTAADKEAWLATSRSLREKFTPVMIEAAMQSMPNEVYDNSSKEIAAQLQQRLIDLDGYIEKYYLLIAKEVDVFGSNKKEYFDIIRHQDGRVSVSIHAKNHEGKQLYHRTFLPEETKEIRVYGLGGKDHIHLSGEAKKSIQLRVFGGDGEDTIEDASLVQSGGKKTYVYENHPRSKITLGEEGKIKTPKKLALYDYQRKAFTYDSYLPIPNLSYSGVAGFRIGWGYSFIRQKFGKEDYASKHRIGAAVSIPSGLTGKYLGRFHHALGKWDFLVGASINIPGQAQNFFGLGNKTDNDETLFQENYYRIRRNVYALQTGLIRDFFGESYFSVKLNFENNDIPIFEDQSILSEANNLLGTEALNIAQVQLAMDLDFRDDQSLPKNGMRFFIAHQNGFNAGLTGENRANFGISEASLEGFASTKGKRALTLGLKIGGGDNYGAVPYYHLFQLGQNNHLHGYQNQRFSGDAMLYFNSELRFEVAKIKTAVLPLDIGLSAFYDRGRVFLDGEESDTWHDGYGVGIYILPVFTPVTLHLSFGFSEESSGLLLFKFGTLLN